MARYSTPRIWCVEGEWSTRRRTDRRTVRPLLETLEYCNEIKHVYNPAPTLDAFELAVKRWGQKQYAEYSIGYFAFHGSSGALHIGRKTITLDDLGVLLDGAARQRLIYFGSCSTVDVSDEDLRAFLRASGARAIVGYDTKIDWLESAAFDLLLLGAAAYYRRANDLERWMRREHGAFCDRLGFKIEYRRSIARTTTAGAAPSTA